MSVLVQQQAESSLGRAQVPAQRAWDALSQHGLPPSPRNYELLHTFFSGANPPLSECLGPCLAPGALLTEEQASAFYDTCIAGASTEASVLEGAGRLAEAAGALAERVAGGREALAGYGETLSHWSGRLVARPTADELMTALVALISETEAAQARNRLLEVQLAASAEHIGTLHRDLVEARRAAATDALTGLANRTTFDRFLRESVARTRADTGSTFSLILLDIDHFKGLNDRHGHRFGDQVLRLVGRLLSDKTTDRDLAARYGGEEFAIVLGEAGIGTGVALAQEICGRLRAQRLVKRGTGDVVGQVTISAGVAQCRPGEAARDVIERADRALYEAKRTGRDRVCPTPKAAVA
ncbi:GGDEF domain-containing protein [Methylorubrum rhodesianum]|jgi:diguanylate cyclase|uniref:diguanylate cyclase n=1 Tax=Methylorubrum rhodesianum TaxID=29427 RepID=A0ABU9ZDX0_9HYPH|nr:MULTISPECIES: GGDEF domain-containing protein [Methylorubrum]MBB5762959.1 diguanylate cyclase [Methylorubrum rhodesianum]MBI1688751.1 GGDEF domain-containing protein [Methylorubrum sp. DB1722]MBK3404808.1 GGDEF domain-containing protein [Methylorubrum rhodesianum]MBY0142815.1 GGDEF domain-containing protein [Methylorubrum populi]